MENLILGFLAIGCGIVTLLGWLWLSAERDLSKTRGEMDDRESATRKLAEELSNLKQMFEDHQKQLSGVSNRDFDIANHQVRLRRDITKLGRKLDESTAKIFALGEAIRAQADVQPGSGGDPAQRMRLNDRLADLERELAHDEAKLGELDLTCERLTDRERMRQALREESGRHQVQPEGWRQRDVDGEESELDPASIEEQFGQLLTMQTAFAEAQRRFHDALVTFNGLMGTPSKPEVQTPTFEVFTSSGAQAQPISTGDAPDSIKLPQPTTPPEARGQSAIIPRLRNLKTPKAG